MKDQIFLIHGFATISVGIILMQVQKIILTLIHAVSILEGSEISDISCILGIIYREKKHNNVISSRFL